jgi:hypothetical protein
MATIVNAPPSETTSNSALGLVLAMIILLVLAILFFVYGLPYFRNTSGTQINVPDKLDVNVNQQ